MRTQKTRKALPWPAFSAVPDVLQAFVKDLGQVLQNLTRGLYDDLAAVQTAPDLVDSLPTASSELRGRLFLVKGGVGVADVLKLCIKDAADAYVFKTVTIV